MKHGLRQLLVLLLLAGCHSLPGAAAVNRQVSQERSGAVPAAASKHSLRISPVRVPLRFRAEARPAACSRSWPTCAIRCTRSCSCPPPTPSCSLPLRGPRWVRAPSCVLAYPDLPKRRAFFVPSRGASAAEDLLVYTFWGDQVRKDLPARADSRASAQRPQGRAAVAGRGLAEYYEVPPNDGINAVHLEQVRHEEFQPNLPRLEESRVWNSSGSRKQDDACDYRESWAWVHLMLPRQPEARPCCEVSAAAADHRHPGRCGRAWPRSSPRPRRRWRNTWRSSPSPRPLINRERTTETQRTPRRTRGGERLE